MNIQILSHKQRLDHLFKRVNDISLPDQGEWSKYLCVLTAGFIEESLRVLLLNYARNKSTVQIQRFLENEIKYITNCKTERILEILTKFDVNWASKFENDIKINSPIDKEIKDSLDSIVANRHNIAHGRSIGIGYAAVNKYYGYCIKAVEILEDTIK